MILPIKQNALIYAAWTVSLIATFGSLFFSEVRGFPPCVLCWYQRVFMYPLVFLFTVKIFSGDKNFTSYILSLTIPGLLIATYHNLLYFGWLPSSAERCTSGISCTAKYIEWLGFITIPFLSWIAFLIITTLIVVQRSKKSI